MKKLAPSAGIALILLSEVERRAVAGQKEGSADSAFFVVQQVKIPPPSVNTRSRYLKIWFLNLLRMV